MRDLGVVDRAFRCGSRAVLARALQDVGKTNAVLPQNAFVWVAATGWLCPLSLAMYPLASDMWMTFLTAIRRHGVKREGEGL